MSSKYICHAKKTSVRAFVAKAQTTGERADTEKSCPVSDGGFLKTCSQSQHKKNLLVKSAQGKTNLFLFGKLQ